MTNHDVTRIKKEKKSGFQVVIRILGLLLIVAALLLAILFMVTLAGQLLQPAMLLKMPSIAAQMQPYPNTVALSLIHI